MTVHSSGSQVAASSALPSREEQLRSAGFTALWLVLLLADVVLAMSGIGQWLLATSVRCPGGASECTADDARLVAGALRGFGAGVLGVAATFLLYLIGLALDVGHRSYFGAVTRPVHIGWSVAALGWIVYAAMNPLLGVHGNPMTEAALVAAPALLALTCFLQGTSLGAAWRSPAAKQRIAGVFALGFFALALTQFLSYDTIQQSANRLNVAFTHLGQPDDYYWAAGSTDSRLGGLLESSPWLVLAYAYALRLRRTSDLLEYFRTCPSYPPGVRWLGRWLDSNSQTLNAWGLVLVATWVIAAGSMLGLDSMVAHNHEASRAAGRALGLLPAYLLLMLPSCGCFHALASSRIGGMPMDTRRRDDLIVATRLPLGLLLFVTGLCAGNLFIAVSTDRSSIGAGLNSIAQGQAFVGFLVAAFVAIVLHYVGLVELPYWVGQSRSKASIKQRTQAALDTAESQVEGWFASAEHALPGSGGASRASELLLQNLACFSIAQERARAAKEIPTHSIRSFGQLATQLSKHGATSVALTVLGEKSSIGVLRSLVEIVVPWVATIPS